MPEPDRKPTIFVALNERILILENELIQADLLLDDLHVPNITNTGRDMSVVGRLQWIVSSSHGSIAQVFWRIINDRNNQSHFINSLQRKSDKDA